MKISILTQTKDNWSHEYLKTEFIKNRHQVEFVDPLAMAMCTDQISIGQANKFNDKHVDKFFKKTDLVLGRFGIPSNSYGIALLRHFEAKKIPTINTSWATQMARDKWASLQIFSSRNLPIPKTFYWDRTKSPQEVLNHELLQKIPFRKVVIKALNGSQGRGVFLATTHAQAKQILSQWPPNKDCLNQDYLIQEYIEESKGQDVRALVVGAQIAGAMVRIAQPGEFRSNIHLGAKGLPTTLSPAEARLAIEASLALGLTVAGIDFLRTRRGPLLLEANPSPGLEGIVKFTKACIAPLIVRICEQAI